MRYAVLVTISVLLTSCAHTSPSGEPEAQAGQAGSFEAEGLVAACGAARFGSLPPDTSTMPPFDSWADLDLSNVGGERPFLLEFAEAFEWFVTAKTDTTRILFGDPRPSDVRRPGHGSATLELRDGRWAPVGWGDCHIELGADGWGNASFIVDPSSPPDPSSATLSVQASEMACAGGSPPTDRDVRAVVVDDSNDSLALLILVEPVHGATTCQGNPDFRFEVELPSALGDREIVDASTYPFEVRWPR